MRSLATILTLLIPFMLTGQTIDHFADSTARWNVANTEIATTREFPSRKKVETTNYGFQGDTVINGKQWLRMVATKDTAFSKNLKLQGYIRSQGPVVLYQGLELSKKPDTLYDFSLEVGDSIQYRFPWATAESRKTRTVEIKQVDSIRVNGEFHKRIMGGQMGFPPLQLKPVWIEGIGSIHGPLFPREAKPFSLEIPTPLDLACTKVNGRQYYENLDYSECQPNKFVGVADPEQQSLSVQPNPFQDYVRVTMEKVRQATLSLYNAQGQPVLRKPITRGQARLSVSHLTPGMYIAQIRSSEGIQTVKLVKEE